MNKNFYITTPVYYANAYPHIGHAYTTVNADSLVRLKKQMGENGFLLTGTDEHGAKIAQKALDSRVSPQELVDDVASHFQDLWKQLNVEPGVFTRTTDPKHKKAISEAIGRLYDKGIIYKGEYEGLYCVGCEQFKNESDLVSGKCPDHNSEPEIMREESYMMKMSDKQDELIELIKNDEFLIRPSRYKREVLSFLQNNKLQDLSISRKNVDWGIPLPFDKTHTVYVWFDAFLSYVTGLDWNGVEFINKELEKYWPSDINLIGKDILRVHATIWPIMLLHLELPVSRGLFVHGHILSGGKKMSKTLGNVISIDEIVEKFGTDGSRYLLLSMGNFGEDVDATVERLTQKYNADLANGLGNLTSRIITLSGDIEYEIPDVDVAQFSEYADNLSLNLALEKIWKIVSDANKYIEETKPWELRKAVKSQKSPHFAEATRGKKVKNEDEFKNVMKKLLVDLHTIAVLLKSFLPQTSDKIFEALDTRERVILFERI